jgi:ATP synthase protein I
MTKAVLLQVLATCVAAGLAAAWGGPDAGLSAALGGLACIVPNALFAVRLGITARRPGGATVSGFFIGEFVKVVATVVLLMLIAHNYRGLNWLALIVGVIVALKSYFLMFFFVRR